MTTTTKTPLTADKILSELRARTGARNVGCYACIPLIENDPLLMRLTLAWSKANITSAQCCVRAKIWPTPDAPRRHHPQWVILRCMLSNKIAWLMTPLMLNLKRFVTSDKNKKEYRHVH